MFNLPQCSSYPGLPFCSIDKLMFQNCPVLYRTCFYSQAACHSKCNYSFTAFFNLEFSQVKCTENKVLQFLNDKDTLNIQSDHTVIKVW